jgi:periplasmic protein TonB
MKLGWVFGLVAAVVLHAGFLLFGGLIVGTHEEAKSKIVQVALLSDDSLEKEKEEDKPEDKKAEDEPMESETEEAPDAAEIVRNLEVSAAAAAPELEAVSLAAIEQALSGKSAGGDFSESLSFASGGRIGGTGKPGSMEEKIENAFNLAEIDQKPRATFRGPPTYPAEMRGKKVEGLVSVIFVVDASGKVTNPKVEKSSHAAFERPALEAVRQWRFEPGLKGGERVSCRMRAPIRFQKS